MNTIDIDTSAFETDSAHAYKIGSLHGFGLGFAAGLAVLAIGWACCGCSAEVRGDASFEEPDAGASDTDAGSVPTAPAPVGRYVVTYDSSSACALPSSGTVVDSTGILSPYHDGAAVPGWTCADAVSFSGAVESVDRTCTLGASMSLHVVGAVTWSSADDGIGTWTDTSTSKSGSCSVAISSVYSRPTP